MPAWSAATDLLLLVLTSSSHNSDKYNEPIQDRLNAPFVAATAVSQHAEGERGQVRQPRGLWVTRAHNETSCLGNRNHKERKAITGSWDGKRWAAINRWGDENLLLRFISRCVWVYYFHAPPPPLELPRLLPKSWRNFSQEAKPCLISTLPILGRSTPFTHFFGSLYMICTW